MTYRQNKILKCTGVGLSALIGAAAIFFAIFNFNNFEKEKEKNIQTKNNELFDKARVDLENNILNSKSFSFIPISSPINLENIKTPISGNEIINLDQNVKDGLVVKAPKRLKVDNINSFTLKSEVEKLDV